MIAARRIAVLATLAATAVLIAVGGLLAWLLLTQSGLDRTIALLDRIDAVGIRVDGARGRLAGPLQFDTLFVETDSAVIEVQGAELDHAPLALLFGRVVATRLNVQSLAVRLREPDSPPPDRALAFMPRWLSASVADGRVTTASLSLPSGRRLEFADVELSGTVTHARIDLTSLRVRTPQGTAAGTARLDARKPLALRAKLDWTLASQPRFAGSINAKGDLDKLELSGTIVAPASASVAATLTSLGPELEFDARIDSDGFDLTPWLADPPLGPLAGSISARGTLQALEATGRLDGRGLPAAGIDVTTAIDFMADALAVRRLRLASRDGTMQLDGSGTVALSPSPAITADISWRGLRWPFDGDPLVTSATGRATLKGWEMLAFNLDGSALAPGYPSLQVAATGFADRDGLGISEAAVSSGRARLTGSGFIGFSALRPWQVTAAIRQLDLSTLRAGLDSNLGFDVAASGLGMDKSAAWAAVLSRTSGTLRGQRVAGQGYVRHRPGLTDFERFDLSIGPARAQISGQLGAGTALEASIVADDLSAIDDELGGAIEGRLSVSGAGAPSVGKEPLWVDASFRGRDLRYGEQHAAVLSLDTVMDLSDQQDGWLRLRAAGITLAGQSIATTRLSLDGRAADHQVEMRVGAGERALSLLGTGAYRDGSYRLAAARIEGAGPQLEGWSLEQPLQALVSRRIAELEPTCFVRAPRRWCIEGRWQAAAGWSASLATESFPLEALAVELPGKPAYRGLLDLKAEARGLPGQPWTGTSELLLRDARLMFMTPSGRREERSLGVTALRVTSTAESHQLTLQSRDAEVGTLNGSATIARLPGRSLGDSPLDGRLRLSTRQLGLLPLVLADIDRADGTLEADVGLSGTVAEPLFAGWVQLDDGALELYQTNLRLKDVTARITFMERALTLKASGHAGEGSFTAEGRMGWQGGQMQGTLDLDGSGLLVADLPEARIEASPNLKFRVDGREIDVSGTVTIPAARIEPRQFVGAVPISADEKIVGSQAPEQGPSAYRVSTDVRMVLGKQVKLNAFGLSGRLEGSVRAQSRADEIAVGTGELEVKDGKYRAYSKELDVERGRLLFAGGPVADPGIDLRAKKDLPGYEVGVIVRGRLRKPELSLYSVPSLPQSQIASLLLVGRSIDTLQSGDRETLGSSTPGLIAQGGSILAGQLGRYVGLDDVAVETDAEYQASLVIGKFLSPRLYVSYGISLTDAINTFKLRYTIGDNWVIRGEAGREASADVEYTVDR